MKYVPETGLGLVDCNAYDALKAVLPSGYGMLLPMNIPAKRMYEKPLHIVGRRAIVYRWVAILMLAGTCYMLDWMPLRTTLRDLILKSLQMAGCVPMAFTHKGSPAIQVGNDVYYYTADCTYLLMLMVLVPFFWGFGATLARNLLRIVIVALVVLGVNLVRTWAATYCCITGTSWFYAHDLPDYVLWSTAIVCILPIIRRDIER